MATILIPIRTRATTTTASSSGQQAKKIHKQQWEFKAKQLI
jgi:hypothetical protein